MNLKEILNNFDLSCHFSKLQNEGWGVLGAWDSNNERVFQSGYDDGDSRGDLFDQAVNRVTDEKSGIESVRIVLAKGVKYKTLVVRGSNS